MNFIRIIPLCLLMGAPTLMALSEGQMDAIGKFIKNNKEYAAWDLTEANFYLKQVEAALPNAGRAVAGTLKRFKKDLDNGIIERRKSPTLGIAAVEKEIAALQKRPEIPVNLVINLKKAVEHLKTSKKEQPTGELYTNPIFLAAGKAADDIAAIDPKASVAINQTFPSGADARQFPEWVNVIPQAPPLPRDIPYEDPKFSPIAPPVPPREPGAPSVPPRKDAPRRKDSPPVPPRTENPEVAPVIPPAPPMSVEATDIQKTPLAQWEKLKKELDELEKSSNTTPNKQVRIKELNDTLVPEAELAYQKSELAKLDLKPAARTMVELRIKALEKQLGIATPSTSRPTTPVKISQEQKLADIRAQLKALKDPQNTTPDKKEKIDALKELGRATEIALLEEKKSLTQPETIFLVSLKKNRVQEWQINVEEDEEEENDDFN